MSNWLNSFGYMGWLLRRRHAVEELGPHLRIVPQDLEGALLHLRLWPGRGLAFLLGELLTGRGAVRRPSPLPNVPLAL